VLAYSYDRPVSNLMFSLDGGRIWRDHRVVSDRANFNCTAIREIGPGRLLFIVRNNVLISGKGSGLASMDHQGKSLNLQVIHNTIINTGDAFKGSSWNGREGMILANNILYSRDKSAMNFPKGKEGVIISGNIVLGDAPKQGTLRGRGLEDFVSLSWDGEKHDATSIAEAPFAHADSKYQVDTDFTGTKRTKPFSGAITK
jgi:hypothetical protein